MSSLGGLAFDGVSTAFCFQYGCVVEYPANFGSVRIFNAKLNGVTPKAAGAVAVNLAKVGVPPYIVTGPLNTTGNAWYEVFKH
jgi:hypothetical protein